MTDNELVEKVARAIYEAKTPDGSTKWLLPWDGLRETTKAHWRSDARAALSVARQAIREECARVAEEVIAYSTSQQVIRESIAAAIRAME